MGEQGLRSGSPPVGADSEELDELEPSSGSADRWEEAFLRRLLGEPDLPGRGPDASALPADLGPEAARFEIRRSLGAGAFGAVFEAFDRKRNALVALKSLTRPDPRALYRFKQEFRSLAELSHPNLVELYELCGRGESWFFTMELVRGQDVRSYLRGAPAGAEPPPEGEIPERSTNEARLRSVLGQLAQGLTFLHDAGKLHRDIKPSNVLVDRHGRVVLLDFGLVVDLTAEGGQSVGAVAGTPHYMAPEQAAGEAIGPAADLYAVGVLLYQALSDRLPFEGTGGRIMASKLTLDPRPPSDFASGLPADLERLCMELLRRAPAERPSGREVLERLATHQPPDPKANNLPMDGAAPAPKKAIAFVGRRSQLADLHLAFEASGTGRAGAALVHGRSGMGKSALVRRFLEELRQGGSDPVLLTGRCFEQESVPYKALDSLVDALGRYLQRIPLAEARALLPRDVATLARLFPALTRVPAVAAAPRRPVAGDELTSRRRAFAALRELLARLGDRAPLVIFIDDLQWGDADGGALLSDLLHPPDAPPLLAVLAYRSDEAEQSECLRVLLPALRAAQGPGLDLAEIVVDALPEAEACDLALSELSERNPSLPPPDLAALPERALAIARESGGWPFFIRELAGAGGTASGEHPSLEAMLASRIAALPEGARRLLEVIAVAGKPVQRAVAVASAALGDDGPQHLGLLRNKRLVRLRGDRAKDEIETYHDRIRETVVGRILPVAKKGLHLDLASALLSSGHADAETLAIHFEAAGETERAIVHTMKAADQALSALGFARATRLYRQAIASLPEGDPRRRDLYIQLGGALGNTGRGPDAAAAYLLAAEDAGAAQKLDLRRRAAEQYLISGRTDEGIAVLRSVLAAVKLTMPATQLGAALRLLVLLFILRLRGLGFRERSAEEIPAGELARIDACAAVAFGMISASPMTFLYFHKRCLLLSLRAGEPYRVLRALLYETGLIAAAGRGDAPDRAAERVERVMLPLVERLRGSGAHFQALEGAVEIVKGASAVFRGRFREGREHLERGLSRPEGSEARMASEASLASMLLLGALYGLGEWKEAARRHAELLEEARERGDRFLEIELSKSAELPALMADRPDQARNLVNRVEKLWSRADRSRHYARLMALGTTALYEDRGIGCGALRLHEEAWAALARSGMLLFSIGTRTGHLHLRARAHLAAAAAPGGTASAREKHLRAVDRDARSLERMQTRVAAAYGANLRAAAAAGRGDRERARDLLAKAEALFLAMDMAMDAAACRRRLGEITEGEEGPVLVTAADSVMRAQNVVDPARMTATLLPGKW